MAKKSTKGAITSERALLPETVLNGKYVIGKVIGEGGFGITYLGLDLNLQIKIAIKEYFPIDFATRNTSLNCGNAIHIIGGETEKYYIKGLNDFASEANRLSRFSELPGIVSVMNFFYENNTAYIVMDYIDGITLKDFLERGSGKIQWKKALKIMRPIISSLKEVHKAGIIHRDISPDNIMVTKQGEIVLIDFGSARSMNENHANTVILKKSYAPLEQYQTGGNQGTWSDVYSLCATLYRMICGVKIPDAIAIAAGQAHISSMKTYDVSIPKELDNVIRRGLEINIRDRFQNMDELEECLYRGKRAKRNIHAKKRFSIIAGIFVLFVTVISMCMISLYNYSIDKDDQGETETVNASIEIDEEKIFVQEDVQNDKQQAIEMDEEISAFTDTPAFLINYQEENGGITISAIDYRQTEIVIPSEIDGIVVKKISGISPNAVSVIIKEGTEIIGYRAFANCVYLESVYIPSTVISIEKDAFKNCSMLKEIIVSENNPKFYSKDGNLYTKDGDLVYGKD